MRRSTWVEPTHQGLTKVGINSAKERKWLQNVGKLCLQGGFPPNARNPTLLAKEQLDHDKITFDVDMSANIDIEQQGFH